MSYSRPQQQRKRAFNRGTFLLVEGTKYDVSNIVHESTEMIPDEIEIVVRKSALLPTELYPCLDYIEDILEHGMSSNNNVPQTDSQSISSRDDNASSSNDDTSTSTVAQQSYSSVNYTPPEKKELLKMVERMGGPAQVPGAVHVDGSDEQAQLHAASPPSYASPKKKPPMVREESTPGAIHIDGPGVKYGGGDGGIGDSFDVNNDTRRESLDYKPPAVDSTKQAPAAFDQANSFSFDSYLDQVNRAASWEQQQQQHIMQSAAANDNDDDSWNDSAQIRAAAAAFDTCQVTASPPQAERKMVQVTEDLELPLHGAQETSAALDRGEVVTSVCIVCRATLRCIRKAQYVLCPECKCLTPLQDTHYNATGGVGLGLLSTYDQSYRVGV